VRGGGRGWEGGGFCRGVMLDKILGAMFGDYLCVNVLLRFGNGEKWFASVEGYYELHVGEGGGFGWGSRGEGGGVAGKKGRGGNCGGICGVGDGWWGG